MLNRLKKFYLEQMFFPGVLSLFFNPFYFARRGLSNAMIDMAKELSGSLIDVGCGSQPYRKLFDLKSYVGLDIDSPVTRKYRTADDLYDGGGFPYADNKFDSALCNQVLEHVFNPVEFLQEVNRILKPGGLLLLTVPFVWDEHEQPYDYARYTSFGLLDLLRKSGFAIRQHRKLGADASVLFQLTNAYLFKVTQSWPKLGKHTFTITVMAFINVLGVVANKLLPDNPDLFLDHVVLAEKIS
jgi:SAM-dependent methyltransferase